MRSANRNIVVEFALTVLGRCPGFPAVRLVEDAAVFLAFQRSLHRLAVFQRVEVFEEQQP